MPHISGEHPDYTLLVTDEDNEGNQDFAFVIKDAILTRFKRLQIKNFEKLSEIELIANLFLLPKEEIGRIFQHEGQMELQLVALFTLYCGSIRQMMSPKVRINPKGVRTTMAGFDNLTYEDVHAGLGLYLSMVVDSSRESSFAQLRKMSDATYKLRSALLYLRADRDNFLQFVLDNTDSAEYLASQNPTDTSSSPSPSTLA